MRLTTLPALCALSSAALLIALPARADDNKPPVISDVKSSSRGGSVSFEAKITDETGVLQATLFYRKGGGKWTEQPMTKNDFDDVFKATVPAPEEYYIQATDLLGNGPAQYGTSAKPMALGGGKGKTAVAQAEPPPPPPPSEPPPEPKPRRHHEEAPQGEPPPPPPEHHKKTAAAAKPAPPVIEHRHINAQPPEGNAFTLRIRIHSEAGIKTAAIYVRQAGSPSWKASIPLVNNDGDSWSVELPPAVTHGEIEYLIAAKDNADQQVNFGDGSPSTPFKLTFKSAGGAAEGARPAQVFTISHASPFRVEPRRPIVLRAQISPGNIESLTEDKAADAEAKVASAKVQILYRGQDANDQVIDMTPDANGGLGGFIVELPAQFEGEVLYYQVVACADTECAIDTGSKKKWNAVLISSSPGQAPAAIDAVSSKAPAGLPE
ncbi:MAG: hypothetical protein JST92_03235 [Deltaproteobacteria bacterium]|nr:hypothetical protein [Deltaproteobacteria bacterium]